MKTRIQNSLIVPGCCQGDHAALGRAIWNYSQEVQTSGNQKALRESANGVIDIFDDGNKSFLEFVSSNKIFLNMDSEYAYINLFVECLVKSATFKFE